MNETESVRFFREHVRNLKHKTLMNALGIEITYVGLDSVKARMPVDDRTVQYFNILHGGASVALAETVASCAAALHVHLNTHRVVGLEINAHPLRGGEGGRGLNVQAEAKPVHIGRRTQVWSVEITNDAGKLICSSRCTLAVVPMAE